MKNRKGLTLVEVIVSMTILVIISIPLFNAINTGLMNIVRAGDRTEDIYLLQNIMDESINRIQAGEELETEITLDSGEKVLLSFDSEASMDIAISSEPTQGTLITVEIEGTNKSLTTFVPLTIEKEWFKWTNSN